MLEEKILEAGLTWKLVILYKASSNMCRFLEGSNRFRGNYIFQKVAFGWGQVFKTE